MPIVILFLPQLVIIDNVKMTARIENICEMTHLVAFNCVAVSKEYCIG